MPVTLSLTVYLLSIINEYLLNLELVFLGCVSTLLWFRFIIFWGFLYLTVLRMNMGTWAFLNLSSRAALGWRSGVILFGKDRRPAPCNRRKGDCINSGNRRSINGVMGGFMALLAFIQERHRVFYCMQLGQDSWSCLLFLLGNWQVWILNTVSIFPQE